MLLVKVARVRLLSLVQGGGQMRVTVTLPMGQQLPVVRDTGIVRSVFAGEQCSCSLWTCPPRGCPLWTRALHLCSPVSRDARQQVPGAVLARSRFLGFASAPT